MESCVTDIYWQKSTQSPRQKICYTPSHLYEKSRKTPKRITRLGCTGLSLWDLTILWVYDAITLWLIKYFPWNARYRFIYRAKCWTKKGWRVFGCIFNSTQSRGQHLSFSAHPESLFYRSVAPLLTISGRWQSWQGEMAREEEGEENQLSISPPLLSTNDAMQSLVKRIWISFIGILCKFKLFGVDFR